MKIRKLKKTTNLLILKAAFEHLVREIAQYFKFDVLFEPKSIEVLQVASEDYLVTRFKISVHLAVHANRKTVTCDDMQLCNVTEE